MRKVVKTEYLIDVESGRTLRLSIERDELMIKIVDAAGFILTGVEFTATRGVMAELTEAISAIESEVIGE